MGKILQVKIQDRPRASELEEEPALRFQAPDGSFFLPATDLDPLQARGIAMEIVDEIDGDALPVHFLLPHHGAVNDPPPEGARHAVLARLLSEDRANGEVSVRFLGRNRSVPPDAFTLDRTGGVRRYVWQIVPTDGVADRPSLADRFQNLRAEFARTDTRVALSLGSGGLKLFSHATALRLLETIGCTQYVDEVWGTSAGALVALLYSHGLSPYAIEQTGYDIYSGRYQLSLRPTKLQVLRHLVRDAILSSDDSRSTGFVDCAKSLSHMLDTYCAEFDPQRPFYAIAYNLALCRSEVLTPTEVGPHLEGFVTQTDPRAAALASASVPLLFMPYHIDIDGSSVPYVDGSTTEDVPLYSIMRKWDLDREAGVETRERLLILYVRLTGTTSFREGRGRMSKLRLIQTIASAAIETMHERDVAMLEGRPDIELLPLHLSRSQTDFFETRLIPQFIRLAKEEFPEQLDRIEERLRAR